MIYQDNNLNSIQYRECPGKALADAQLFLAISNVLKLFTIGPPTGIVDFKSEDIKYASGLIR